MRSGSALPSLLKEWSGSKAVGAEGERMGNLQVEKADSHLPMLSLGKLWDTQDKNLEQQKGECRLSQRHGSLL